MLADTLIQYPESEVGKTLMDGPLVRDWRLFTDKLRGAQRYVLQRDAVQMLLGIADSSPHRLLAALPLCRLPYPSMWVEFSFKDREKWMNEDDARKARLVTNEASPPPQRLGFYLEQLDDEPGSILIQQAWVHEPNFADLAMMMQKLNASNKFDAGAALFAKPFKLDPADIAADPRDVAALMELARRIEPEMPPWKTNFWGRLLKSGPEAMEAAIENAMFDLRTEWRFIIALLATLNSRNVISIGEPADLSKLNKSRRKTGKPEMLDYRDIKLSLSRVQRNRSGLGASLGRVPLRAEKVKGHFKLRRTGLFWWSMHFRHADLDPVVERTIRVGAGTGQPVELA